MILLLQASAELPGGYGVALLQSLLALAAVCVLAWVVLRWASQRGLGTFARGTRVKVIERVPLDARRTLWLVKVGGKVLLIGAGDGASPNTLTELREDELPAAESNAKGATFVEVLRRAASGETKRTEETKRPE
ncbi:flagellar biosynthetic protein FliO [Sandaracinus amylolyticus]|uniref:flagellar biosynthetic protein FliO n=1 Tax=Sandaracinus amylolyticus TaxID=927083 RepID=UPI001F43FF24|nr:flagellar biosynthetic protein FliO [Sandaracinus amylolyticus]UJR78680.1 Hypothetical protein I5071_7110 [Sandaracinus amylolyticus]